MIKLFLTCKTNLIPSPLLLSYDSSKYSFLKTDCSAEGMRYILIHPNDSLDSLAAIKYLADTGGCVFDLSLDGPILRLVLFGFRANMHCE